MAGSAKETIQISRKAQLTKLRRLVLASQGLTQNQPFGRGASGTLRTIQHLGYTQIDTISVVQRAHHHVLHTRVPNYEPKLLDRLLKQRKIFEYWSHAAAFLPMAHYRFSLPYKQAIKSGKTHWFRTRDETLMQRLLEQIQTDGPLRSRDLESERPSNAGWWEWKPAKRALEQLYMQGDLMVSAREGFQKTYDLPERVLPADTDTSMPSIDEYAEHLIEQQLNCQGAVSLKGVTYLRRDAALRQAVRQQIDSAHARGDLLRITSPGGTEYFCRPAQWEASAVRAYPGMHILSPFDNSVIQRERLLDIFDFDYQIECYVPAAKRVYGYFCLPLLYRDQFVGRIDCKAHRTRKELELISVHFSDQNFDTDEMLTAFVEALHRQLDFQDCLAIRLGQVTPEHLRQPLQRLIEQHL